MKPQDAYQWLRNHSIERGYLESTAELAAWDQRTYMPPKGHAHRAEQMAVLARLLHEKATDPRIGERLAELEGTELTREPSSPEAVNCREWQMSFDRTTRIPQPLEEELARVTASSETAWAQAKARNDWNALRPHLQRVFALLREKADAIGYENEPYDALLEEYESGETTASLTGIFEHLRQALVPLLGRITRAKNSRDPDILRGRFPVEKQERLVRTVAQAIGYDFERGRLDTSPHPFTIGIGPGDTRITTRYSEERFAPALFGTIHEAGHAIYEQGLMAEHWGTPMGTAASLGVHESQSRLWENMVGRSEGFWSHFLPLAKKELTSLATIEPAAFIRAVNNVQPSLIRVEADEITYNLHILVRFELELELMRDNLPVDELPAAWNEKMNTYLGVRPADGKDGVMQDVHWPAGLVGYFPTYTLGNIYAAQLMEAASACLGDIEAQIARGEFAPLRQWLGDNVHKVGKTYFPRELIRQVTGEYPNPTHLIHYFERKYSRLFDL